MDTDIEVRKLAVVLAEASGWTLATLTGPAARAFEDQARAVFAAGYQQPSHPNGSQS
jgi:hypothetical protein